MNWIDLVLKFLPGVLSTVMAVEAAIGAGNGATKKALVMSAIAAGAQSAQAIPETHVQAVSTLVDATVQVLNSAGKLSGPKVQVLNSAGRLSGPK